MRRARVIHGGGILMQRAPQGRKGDARNLKAIFALTSNVVNARTRWHPDIRDVQPSRNAAYLSIYHDGNADYSITV